MNICVFAASHDGLPSVFESQAAEFGTLLAKRGHRLIYGGGRCGLMGICANAVLDGGGFVTGIVPKQFDVDGAQFENLSRLIITNSINTRKNKMLSLADAVVALPGGIGTFDELFEAMVLDDIGVHNYPIALLNTGGFFNPLMSVLQAYKDSDFISSEPLDRLIIEESPAALLERIEQIGKHK